MKNIVKVSAVAVVTLVIGMTSISTTQSNKSLKKNGLKFSQLKLSINKAFAATNTERQLVYDAAKREVNTELEIIISEVNLLLNSAKITSCSGIPAASATAFYSNAEIDLYSSSVGAQAWPIGSITGVTFDKRMDLTAKGSSTIIGSLFVDCDSGAAMVKYVGKTLAVPGDDTDILIAYHEDESTGNESILMFSDYNADTGYSAGKMAIHYIESASSQTVTYAYKDATDSLTGTILANTSGTVTGGTDGDVMAGQAVTDLRALTGNGAMTYSAASVSTYSIPAINFNNSLY